jgi:gentisate 1,2-dioxygenase
MGRAEQCRSLVTDVRARASKESSPILKAEWENLAETYVRLAEQSEDATGVNLTYDPIWDILDRSAR